MELYRASFPVYEQREEFCQKRVMNDREYHFNTIWDKDVFIGLILFWETEKFLYIEHFCILPEMRNKGYGKKVLEGMRQTNKAVILEIDPPVDDISFRRKVFYERLGYVANTYEHYHPAYLQGRPAHRLIVMSLYEPLTAEIYEAFYQYLTTVVMRG